MKKGYFIVAFLLWIVWANQFPIRNSLLPLDSYLGTMAKVIVRGVVIYYITMYSIIMQEIRGP